MKRTGKEPDEGATTIKAIKSENWSRIEVKVPVTIKNDTLSCSLTFYINILADHNLMFIESFVYRFIESL